MSAAGPPQGARPPGGERRAAPIGGDHTSYLALTFDADGDNAEAWADELLESGALSIDVADAHAGTPEESPLFDEPGMTVAPRWPVSRLTALFATEESLAAALAGMATRGRAVPPHETYEVADTDWVRATQAQFVPLQIADGFWIVPSWCEPADPAAINLALDPGLAFGTGSHPTTRLCLRWLAAELRAGERVLDYGCGSGILAIAASRLGAGRVVGTDIDPNALAASRANAARNSVAAIFVSPERVAAGEGAFDVIVANILANPLRVLAPEFADRVRPGGRIVLSGILAGQADAVITTYRRWFNIGICASDDGWIALSGTRTGSAVA